MNRPNFPLFLRRTLFPHWKKLKKLSNHSRMAKLQAQKEYRVKSTNEVTMTPAMLFLRYFKDAGNAARLQNNDSMQL